MGRAAGYSDVNEDLSSLRDPVDRTSMVREGDELVARSGKRYPIVRDIPRFLDGEDYAVDFGSQWNRFPKTQLDSHTGLPLSRDRLNRCFKGELSKVAGKLVLEAGSGAGRFTEVLLAEGAVLDSFDISSAVDANARNNGDRDFTLVQADILALPFEPASYDFVVCLGVIQHTPDSEETIARLWEMVRPGGRLVIDHYRRTRWTLPPPIGDAGKAYRKLVLALPQEKRWPAVKRIVDFWFPVYWRFRHSRWARRILARIAGMNFYYGELPLTSREALYEWALLDTHDALTDTYKRFRTVNQIRGTLQGLGATHIAVWEGGNGVEAVCEKPGESSCAG
jgi:SAM-dependent methyltransferase